MLSLYSDASYMSESKTAVTATIILGDDDCLKDFLVHSYYGMKSSEHAELLGVAQGLEWVRDHAPDEDIRIISDNSSIVKRIADYPDDRRIPNGPQAPTWVHVFNLLDVLNRPQVAHIRAHQSRHNPNIACDMVCTALIRQLNGGER